MKIYAVLAMVSVSFLVGEAKGQGFYYRPAQPSRIISGSQYIPSRPSATVYPLYRDRISGQLQAPRYDYRGNPIGSVSRYGAESGTLYGDRALLAPGPSRAMPRKQWSYDGGRNGSGMGLLLQDGNPVYWQRGFGRTPHPMFFRNSPAMPWPYVTN